MPEVIGRLRCPRLPAPPPNPAPGEIYYDEVMHSLMGWNGTGWEMLYHFAQSPSGPAGGDLSGEYPNPQIATNTITDAEVTAANKDGSAATPSLRTLGSGGQQAVAGNDTRLSDARVPSGAAGGDLSGNYPNPSIDAPPMLRAQWTGTISVAQNAWTVVTGGSWALTQQPDWTGYFNSTTGEFTIPKSGIYLYVVSIGFSANAAGVRGASALDGAVSMFSQIVQACATPNSSQAQVSGMRRHSLNDIVKLQGYQNSSGGNLNMVSATMDVCYLGRLTGV